MWIRSQDKSCLMNANKIFENGQFIMSEHTALDIHFVLGKYKTKKRCLEVLDEIHEHINIRSSIHMYEVDAAYQMPEK
jgi:hypothetical protein